MSLRTALKASLQDNPGPDEGSKHVSATTNKRKTKESNKKNAALKNDKHAIDVVDNVGGTSRTSRGFPTAR